MFTPQVYRYKQRWSKPKLMTHLNNGAKKGERGVFAISAQQAVGQCEKSANKNSAKYKNTEQQTSKGLQNTEQQSGNGFVDPCTRIFPYGKLACDSLEAAQERSGRLFIASNLL